jgi:HlyD family type I secretion membrane fusion protein
MKQVSSQLERLKIEFSRLAASGPAAVTTPPAVEPAEIQPTTEANRLVRNGVIVILGFFGFLGGWAALSPLDSATITYGVVGAEGSRKAVQHLDGGVVDAILVKDGDLVAEGQELIRLDQVQPRSTLEIYSSAVQTQLATIARLEAEAADADAIEFPKALLSRAEEPAIKALTRSQEQLFAARRTANSGQIDTLIEQIKQARSQVAIYRGQVETAENQYRMVNEELAPKQMLYDKGYATNSPVMQLRRAAAALLGQKQEYTGHIDRLEHSISQLESQTGQIGRDYRLKVALELEDARNKLADANERQRVAQDILDRTIIRAPAAGYVLGMTVNTVGGVVTRGEKLLEIVPAGAGLVIKARLAPSDGVEVHQGMRTELRVLSAHGRKMPVIHGVVRNRSADVRTDPATASTYYDLSVSIDPGDLATIEGLDLLPGTPIEVIVPTGARTALQYMLEPISASLRHGMREK